jgi:catechol 2,3-dioxygenase-like lactoylglutathione lyase family enzyme
MQIDRLDHLVLTVKDMEATIAFYTRILGMEHVTFGKGQFHALAFGQQKINLHHAHAPMQPHADKPLPGTGDLCLITTSPIDHVAAELRAAGVAIIEGPVPRRGALGRMMSVYFRDPDNNLVEVARYD